MSLRRTSSSKACWRPSSSFGKASTSAVTPAGYLCSSSHDTSMHSRLRPLRDRSLQKDITTSYHIILSVISTRTRPSMWVIHSHLQYAPYLHSLVQVATPSSKDAIKPRRWSSNSCWRGGPLGRGGLELGTTSIVADLSSWVPDVSIFKLTAEASTSIW